MKQHRKLNTMIYAMLIKLLMDGTRSCAELAEETGLHKLTVYQACREFHRQGLIHINMYENDSAGKPSIKIYMWGEAKDAKRRPKPRNQIRNEYRARKRMADQLAAMAA